MTNLAYKANADHVVDRLRSLYERRAMDRIFAILKVAGQGEQTLAEFRKSHPQGQCDYPDPSERIEFWDHYLKEQPRIEDDALPSAYLYEMDMALWGGLFGAETIFTCDSENGHISSNAKPVLKVWSEFEGLRFDRAHPWFQKYLRQLKMFAAGAVGKFGVCPICVLNGFHFSWELVGPTEAYVGAAEHPDMVRRAMELAFEVCTAVLDAYFENVPLFNGGTFDIFCEWLPGRTVMESVDAFSLTSVPFFEEWGRASLERIFARYDGGEVHIHGNGRHQLEAVASVKGLKALYLGDDTGFPRAFAVLRELRGRSGDLPLTVDATFQEFSDKLERHDLPGGVLYRVEGVDNADVANRCMERVRAYRA
jgi:hypothetical protein